MNDSELTHCGSLKIGEEGEKKFGEFGEFTLSYQVCQDGIVYKIIKNKMKDSFIGGFLKYAGWNRFKIEGLTRPNGHFEIYVHEWPDFKDLMDYLYYNLGYQISQGTYQKSFERPE